MGSAGAGGFGLAKGAPSWVLAPSVLGGRVWLKVGGGLRVLGLNEARTAAVDLAVGCEWEGSASAAVDAGFLALLTEPLASLSPVLDVKVSDSLVIRAPAGRSAVEISIPAEREEPPLRSLPEQKLRAPAYGVFDEVVKQLRKLRGSGSVRVRVRAEGAALLVEPPRRVFKLGEAPAEPLEVRVFFGDLQRVLEAFRVAGLQPHSLWLGSGILGIEAERGTAKAVALVAGQVD